MKEILHYEMKSFGFDDLFGKHVRGWVNDPEIMVLGRINRSFLSHWIDQSTKMNANNYGYLWWLRDEDSVFSYSALGDGGNVICCVPVKNLVVAIASEFFMHARDRWQLIKEYLVSQ